MISDGGVILMLFDSEDSFWEDTCFEDVLNPPGYMMMSK